MKARGRVQMACGPHERFAPGLEKKMIGQSVDGHVVIDAERLSSTEIWLIIEIDIPDEDFDKLINGGI